MNKHSVFKEWLRRHGRVAAPFSVGGGGASFGPNAASSALEDLVSNLKRKYGTRAPRAVARTEQTVLDTLGPAFQAVPAGRISLGRRAPDGSPETHALARGSFSGGRPRQAVAVFDPSSPQGRATAFHEAGHLADPMLHKPEGVAAYSSGLHLRAERAATLDALKRMAGDQNSDPDRLLQAYGAYLQQKFPMPAAVEEYISSNPIQQRAMGVATRAAARANAAGGALRQAAQRQYNLRASAHNESVRTSLEAQVEALKPIIAKQIRSKGRVLPPNVDLDDLARQEVTRRWLGRTTGAHETRASKGLAKEQARAAAKLETSPRYDEIRRAERTVQDATRISRRHTNSPHDRLERLRTMPFDRDRTLALIDWFDAQRQRLDIAFGAGAGDRALAPILEHIGWATP